jgi:hypothetical protein
MADRYQSNAKKSTKKFEVMGRKEVAVRLPLHTELWKALRPEFEQSGDTATASTYERKFVQLDSYAQLTREFV